MLIWLLHRILPAGKLQARWLRTVVLRPLLLGTLLMLPTVATDALAAPAAEVYREKCAACHGAEGGGVEGLYEGPLYGDDSVDELAERIAETMPEDDPESCVGDEAREVAAYIHESFYSVDARKRLGLLAAPRIELSRLTAPQHRKAIADLLGSFLPDAPDSGDAEGGLKAQYYDSEQMNKANDLKLERVDRKLEFDFGEGAPVEGMSDSQFSISWRGSLFARDTGLYEFRIRTLNGVRLVVNADLPAHQRIQRDDSSASLESRLIDGWVTIGKMRTLTGKMFLIGGEYYPVQVQFFKFKDPASSLILEWKPPHGVWRVMDQQVLSTRQSPRTFAVANPFPADDRSLGYERGSSISREWYSAATAAAVATADEVLDRLAVLSGVKNGAEDEAAKLGEFLVEFAGRAFRRPLTPEERELFGKTLFQEGTPKAAVRRGVILALTSPDFLYTELPSAGERPTDSMAASRLAFALWDTLPDGELRRAAEQNELSTQEQIAKQAERMLADPRTRTKMQAFFRHWLELDERDLTKDRTAFPEFDDAVVADLRRSLELFTDEVLWSDSSDYRQLLTADYLLLNDRLRKLYSKEAPPESDGEELENVEYSRIAFDSEGRAGVLTHPYLLSAFAYHDNTSPIHRGVFLTRNVIGRKLKPPPQAVSFDNSQFSPELTMREKVTRLTRDQACQSCHEVINPLGFALENYDAVGRWRTSENDRPIDTHSDYTSAEGASHKLTSARDIAQFAVGSRTAQRAFVRQVFQHLVRQSPEAYGPEVIEQLTDEFVADGYHMRRLLARIATLVAAQGLDLPGSDLPGSELTNRNGPTSATASSKPSTQTEALP